ncbi:Ig-like domain-containing protein [Rhodococcus gannanensis]|uniref:Ig-like domain-containing protein n=1 Tax=Rhodococcus gannanensis TaxID=1960308 RepID=A0ABW4P9X2_9NOCA
MSRPSARRLVAAVSVAAFAALGLSAIGAGTASAAMSVTETTGNIKVTKTVSTSAVERGDTVTYKTVFEATDGVDRNITRITDVHPEGFEYVSGSAKLTSAAAETGMATEAPTPTVDTPNNEITVNGDWLLSSRAGSENKNVTFQVTYRVSQAAEEGKFDSGLVFDAAGAPTQAFDPMGVTVKVAPPGKTTKTVVTAPATAIRGKPVELVATISRNTVGGAVQFKDNGEDIGSSVVPTKGQAALSYAFPTDGIHTITAEFTGSGDREGSASEPVLIEVTAGTGTVISGPSEAQAGTPVTFLATVSPGQGGGTVEFKDSGVLIGKAEIIGGTGTLDHVFTVNGEHAITGTFTGNSVLNESTSEIVTVTVVGGVDPETQGTGSIEDMFNNLFGS